MNSGLPRVNAFTVGQVLYLLEVMTVLMAGLYRVDAFNQPGIEEGKRLTYGMAGRHGYEEKRAEVDAWMQKKNPKYVL